MNNKDQLTFYSVLLFDQTVFCILIFYCPFMIMHYLFYLFKSYFFSNHYFFIQPKIKFPDLSLGNSSCCPLSNHISSGLFDKYKEESEQFLKDSYILFAGQTFKKDSLETLHFLYSSFLGSLHDGNSCIGYPNSYVNNIMPLIKDWKCNMTNFKECQAEVFFFEHGLRFANPNILNYIQKRDILDIGACEGDSAYILMNRTNKCIFSYEPSASNVENFKLNAKILKFNSKKSILVPYGLSDKIEQRRIVNCIGGSCTSFIDKQGTYTRFVTIDNEVTRRNIKVGFVKVDVEGFGVNVFRGGIKAFRRDRPVFSYAIYHNFEEMFTIPKLILELGNYELEFHMHHQYSPTPMIYETIVFAYPKEIVMNPKKR